MIKTRNTAAIAARRIKVSDWYLHGKTQWEIAELTKTNQATISRDIKAIIDAWKKEAINNIDELRAKELMKIDHLELEYTEAWDRSKGRKEITATERTDLAGGQRAKASVKHEDRDGNPAFLAGIQWCITKRCELLGLNAPTQEHVDHDVVFRVIYDRGNPSTPTGTPPKAG
jgi:hypothetical protein